MVKVGIVVPTYKKKLWDKFIEAWDWSSEQYDLTLYMIEDQPTKTKVPLKPTENIKFKHYTWKEIDKDLGKDSWIIPRRSSGIKSYGYLKAYQDGMDYILVLDDDCYPIEWTEKKIEYLIDQHTDAFEGDFPYSSFFDVGNFFYPDEEFWMRGSPIRYRKPRSSVISIGGWDKNPDLDAWTQLENQSPELEVTTRMTNVPKNLGLTMCGMNVMFSRETIPIAYFLLQSKELGVERCDDIWAGLFMKKILDHFDKPMCINGHATVHHDRASNPLASLIAEGGSVGYNELLWDRLLPLQFIANNEEGNITYLECYRQLTHSLREDWFPKGYLDILKPAMLTWIKYFK